MSMLGGLGGGDAADFMPSKAPKVPKRADENIDRKVMNSYRKLASKDSYAQSILGGSAPSPSKSYSAQLFGGGSM